MRCRRVRRLLPIYQDGGLPTRTIKGIDRHLAECGECRREASELEDALSVLRAVPRVRPAPEFRRAVIAAVRRESVRTRQGLLERVLVWQPAFATAGIAACVLLAAVAIWQYGRRTPPVIPVPSNPVVEAAISDDSAEAAPVAAEVQPAPHVTPRVKVVAQPRPHRPRPIKVAAAPAIAPREVSVPAVPAPKEPALEELQPEVVAAVPVHEGPVSFDILGVDVLIADIGLSDISLADDGEDAFALASATEAVAPAALEEPVGGTHTEPDATTPTTTL